MEIKDSTGRVVGCAKFRVFQSQEEIDVRFSGNVGNLRSILRPPLGEFEDLEINEEHRKLGHGRTGMKSVEQGLRKAGAATAILRVAWGNEEPWEAARDWRIKFYESEGWTRFDAGLGEYQPVWMVKYFS